MAHSFVVKLILVGGLADGGTEVEGITKRDQLHDMQANILAPIDSPPEHAFKWKVTPDVKDYVINCAVQALQQTYVKESHGEDTQGQ